MRIHLITAESPESRRLRWRRLIQFPQLTMPLIAALTPPGHEVHHTDEIVEPVDLDRPADLAGITAPTPSALHAYALADALRRRRIPVVMGGPHATALPDEAARHADAVVVGEAEDTWPQVLEDAAAGRLRRFYRSTHRARLDGQPAPRWDLIKGRHYGKSVTIATRGCPHRCDYCTIPLLYGPGTMRYRPIEEVVREVASSPTRAVVFWDDNIGASPRYSKALFRALAPLGKWWTSQCTAAAARDEEFQGLAAASGCKALFMGFESISQESLDATHKGHNRVAGYGGLIRSLHRNGIAAHLGIMFGFDQDDRGIFRRTVEFLEEAAVDVATMSMVVPMPGTATFRRLQAEGRILTTDWSKYDGKKHCVFRPARMSPEELEAGTEWASRRFYSLRSIASRLWRSRTGTWWNLPRNLGYRMANSA
ncbi:MAG TPA: radical SAM protein [Candidatus Polarisedimenticolia bacterium]|nr:radical SAM protein [Candidatus Polarisedimenticolia bacterium]